MEPRTPLTLITGPLGSGKTTLLRHILATTDKRIAIVMNEFGEIAIDTKVLQGKNVQIADLGGGCVCCSLLGEFEVAIAEIISTIDPDLIVVETTGLAEPDALVFDIQEQVPSVRLDTVITVMDADAMLQYPQVGHTTRIQVEAADVILLNKVDLVPPEALPEIEATLHQLNAFAQLFPAQRCQIDPDLLFGISRTERGLRPHHLHQPEFDAFGYASAATFDRRCFEAFIQTLDTDVYRAKGFVHLTDGSYLFNFVAGRWDLEPFEQDITELVFIGKQMSEHKCKILAQLQTCELTSRVG